MKIDAQGAELDILEGSKDIVENIKVVEIEAWFTNKYEDT